MTPIEGRERGEKRAKRGIKAAAYGRDWDIARDELRLLETMLRNPDASVTTDDIVDNLAKKFPDGGNWRASVVKRPQAAGIIASDGTAKSARPSRHGGYTTRWKLTNRSAAECRCDDLREFFRSNPNRPADKNETGAAV
jgi:hypothetical protein